MLSSKKYEKKSHNLILNYKTGCKKIPFRYSNRSNMRLVICI